MKTNLAWELKLKNIVAFHDYAVKLNLCDLYNQLRKTYLVSFEPELSPALMLKLPYTVRIFRNGKVIFTGLRNFSELDSAYEKVANIVNTSKNTSN